jgi:HAMP domain-containing protein
MQERRRGDLPNQWVVLPVLGACLAAVLATWVGGPLLGLFAVAGLLAAYDIEKPLRALSAVVAKIAGGDRYAIMPEQPKGPLRDLAQGAETLRQAVIEADALVVD